MALNIQIPEQDELEIGEQGKNASGESVSLDRRLFMQLLAFGGVQDSELLVAALENAGIQGALYADLNDPFGVALLTFSDDPDYFLSDVRHLLTNAPFAGLTPKPEYTLLGRSYSIGYETDLAETLIKRPIRHATNPDWPWAIWYPLRRSGQFEQLPASEQRTILMEHGGIGRAYGKADLAHDVRLSCHGLDKNDNDFIAGLMGKELAPLSKIVQRMRRTQQTSLYLEKLGPFFIGKAIWQSK